MQIAIRDLAHRIQSSGMLGMVARNYMLTCSRTVRVNGVLE